MWRGHVATRLFGMTPGKVGTKGSPDWQSSGSPAPLAKW